MNDRVTVTLVDDGLRVSILKEYIGNIFECEEGCWIWYVEDVYVAEAGVQVKESFDEVQKLIGE